MGLSASQVRFLQLTDRKNRIGRELERYSNQKTSTMREMDELSLNFNNKIKRKCLKMSSNAGISYVDLSYSNLMQPNATNQFKPYLLTDSNGRVVLDSKYEEFAKKISPDGAPVGDWSSQRAEILSALTGKSAEDIENASNESAEARAAKEAMGEAKANLDAHRNKETSCVRGFGVIEDFLEHVGNVTHNGTSINLSSGVLDLGSDATGASNTISSFIDTVKASLGQYFEDGSLYHNDRSTFNSACDTIKSSYTSVNLEDTTTGITKTDNGYQINTSSIVAKIMGAFYDSVSKTQNGTAFVANGDINYIWRDTNSEAWQSWKAEYDIYKEAYDSASNTYETAVKAKNETFTATDETLIKFYDQLFQAIADNGWVVNYEVSDSEYLGEMLQNNEYFITQMNEGQDASGKDIYIYDTSIATNIPTIYTVSDSDARNDALVEYEAQKRLINKKEARIDQRMKNLETEQSCINTMLEGIQAVMKKNIDSNFNIFS